MKTLIEKIDDIIETLEDKGMESVVELMNLVRKKVEQADESNEPATLEITPEYCSDYFEPYTEDDEDEDEFFDPVSTMAWWVK